MLDMRYEVIDHTADVMIKAYGKNIEECFENAAFALIDQMVDASKVRQEKKVYLQIDGDTKEELLYNFLSEILFQFDANRLVLSRFEVHLAPGQLSCTAWGEGLDLERQSPKTEVKAITYHMLTVDEIEPSVTVLFDV